MGIEAALNEMELRMRCLVHSRQAFQLLPALEQPRILDIGCGQGSQTLELAKLGGGQVVGIDVDAAALEKLRQRIVEGNLDDRISTLHVSLLDNGFDECSFDILWEEGVLHLLNSESSLPECQRLLRPGGTLVMHETISWFENTKKKLQGFGFEFADQYLLPKHYWWTDYGAPLEQRIQAYKKAHADLEDSQELARHEAAVAAIKNDPDRLDCGFFLVRKHT